MPLIPAAIPAVADRQFAFVRFAMKDGAKFVDVLVSNQALEQIDGFGFQESRFDAFKRNRKCFERIASEKYTRGHIEMDGSVSIWPIDLAFGYRY